jgi:cytochrome oxidase Cu insertion factor (SCO1/SenC/PrrC family)
VTGSLQESAQQLRARNLRTLAALAALFLVPLLFAFFLYYGTAWRPAGHSNHGTLITPPRPLPQTPLTRPVAEDATRTPPLFRGKWSLVYVGSGACDADCHKTLYVMRQTRLALNTDMGRVARVFLVTSDCCDREFLEREHPGLDVRDAAAAEAGPLIAAFPLSERAHTLFIVDPLGNLMMSYDARQNPHGLLEDLHKLLRLSQIG